jgi:hypothetical protein
LRDVEVLHVRLHLLGPTQVGRPDSAGSKRQAKTAAVQQAVLSGEKQGPGRRYVVDCPDAGGRETPPAG